MDLARLARRAAPHAMRMLPRAAPARALPVPVPVRSMSREVGTGTMLPVTGGSPTTISLEEAASVLDMVRTFIKIGMPGRLMDDLQNGDDPVEQKWMTMTELRLRTELHVINGFGFEPGEMGMMAYRQTINNLMQTVKPDDLAVLQVTDKEIWTEMISRTFGVSPSPLSVEEARQVVAAVAGTIQGAQFLAELEGGVKELGDGATDLDKSKVMQNMLMNVWSEVLPQFGYVGDEGYVKFQASMVQHSTDPQIGANLQAAHMAIASKTGLMSGMN